MSAYRILIADDHMMFCDGVKLLLQDISGLEVIGCVSDGLQLLDFLKHTLPDMVIVDISMPKLQGIEATRVIKKQHADIKVLILTMHKDKEHLHHALEAGADGYLIKDDAGTELVTAVETVREGKAYISILLMEQMVELLRKTKDRNTCKTPDRPLSDREIEVLRLLAEGRSNKEIATILEISVRTVEHHRDNMKKKLQLKRMADLIRYAVCEGLVSGSPT